MITRFRKLFQRGVYLKTDFRGRCFSNKHEGRYEMVIERLGGGMLQSEELILRNMAVLQLRFLKIPIGQIAQRLSVMPSVVKEICESELGRATLARMSEKLGEKLVDREAEVRKKALEIVDRGLDVVDEIMNGVVKVPVVSKEGDLVEGAFTYRTVDAGERLRAVGEAAKIAGLQRPQVSVGAGMKVTLDTLSEIKKEARQMGVVVSTEMMVEADFTELLETNEDSNETEED